MPVRLSLSRVRGLAQGSSAPQGEDAVHLFFRKFEIEHVEVFPEVILARRLGDSTDLLLLHEPAQGDLGRRLAVGLAYLLQGGVILNASSGERGVGGEQMVHLLCLAEKIVLAPVGMVLDLIAEDLRVFGRLLNERRREVAHPYVQYAAFFLQFPYGAEGLT